MKTNFKIETNLVKVLLEKYFDGETTLREEETLRKYFSQSEIDQEFKQYSPLFSYFSQEKEKMDDSSYTSASFPQVVIDKNPLHKFRKIITSRQLFFRLFSLSAAAALAIFTYVLWPSQQTGGAEMMIGGERINNEMLAITKADAQLAKISSMMGLIGQNTNSLKKLSDVEKSLSIINKK